MLAQKGKINVARRPRQHHWFVPKPLRRHRGKADRAAKRVFVAIGIIVQKIAGHMTNGEKVHAIVILAWASRWHHYVR
ncbi:MAG: hypothetical protein R2873_34680 [Caldilineaceae bacterium]